MEDVQRLAEQLDLCSYGSPILLLTVKIKSFEVFRSFHAFLFFTKIATTLGPWLKKEFISLSTQS